ncbi:hypothetical protein GCM10020229_50720 [Kitasatospora albolonga]
MNGSAIEVFGHVPVTVPGTAPGEGPASRSLIHPVALNFGLSSEGAQAPVAPAVMTEGQRWGPARRPEYLD